MVTPTHIVPEWYFLPFYAILRSVPNKLGGVILLLASILVLFALPFYSHTKIRSSIFRSLYQIMFWFFFSNCLILGWIGGKSIEPPFYLIGQISTFLYFFFLLVIIPFINNFESLMWKEYIWWKKRNWNYINYWKKP
jgi:quinol-cytochrome oxidoreductase complex cytochrome b subunit